MTARPDDVRHHILATAGHVDHGKSALVRALTGVDPDRLPEEKARGVTIDLGFAHFAVATPTARLSVGIVDVPGHEDFVRNMVAGVGSVDAALLVVAADDGWMPQTEEHLQILTYLGVNAAVVALTKADLVADVGPAAAAVRDRLRGTPFECAPVVPTSVPTNQGLDLLREAIAAALAAISPSADVGKPRLPVDRVFTLKGIGTVVTGTLTGGALTRNQSITVHPTGADARIRSIQLHNRDATTAPPGARVALNLPDLHPGTSRDPRLATTVRRGDVVTLSSLGRPSRYLYALLSRSRRALSGVTQPPPLKHGTRVRLHHATTDTPARLRLLDTSDLNPGHQSIAHLALDGPLFAFIGDRFILRDANQRHTLAGGTVLAPDAPARPKTNHVADLAARASDLLDPATLVTTELPRARACPTAGLLVKSPLDPATVSSALRAAQRSNRAILFDDWACEPALWTALRTATAVAVDAHHHAHPDQIGLPIAAVRTVIESDAKRLPPDAATALHAAIVRDLCNDGFACTAAALHRRSHKPALPPRLAAAGDVVRRRLAENPLDPPSRKDLCRTDAAHQALRFLVATAQAVELSPDVVVSADAYARAAAVVRGHLRAHGPATVTQLKSALAATRRVVVPLLERLDRDGVTRRTGDVRTLR